MSFSNFRGSAGIIATRIHSVCKMSSSWRGQNQLRGQAGPSDSKGATQNWRQERIKSFIEGNKSESWRNGSSEPSKKEKSESWKGVWNKGPQRITRYGFKHGSLGRPDFADTSFLKKLSENYSFEDITKYLIVNLDEYKKVLNDNLSKELVYSLTELNAKICSSTSVLEKHRILSITVNKEFVNSWNKQISTVAVESNETVWKNIQKNLDNILLIYENGLDLMPSHCWFLIRSTLTLFDINIKFIQSKCPSNIFTSFSEKLILLRENVQFCENRFSKRKVVQGKKLQEELLPEDDYRTINIFPTTKELVIKERNFVRKNITIGAYKDIPHYLDVQFRLQREDFLNPIREDLADYLNNINRHFFNIKIYEEVTVLKRAICRDQICFKIAIKMNKYMQNHFKDNSRKKFMNNSLLIFTDDDFETIFCGLVTNSDSIASGELTVAFEETFPTLKRNYKMVECIVFFEPYYHALKVLQTLSQTTLPMSKYIVEVRTSIARPRYLPLDARISDSSINKSQKKAFQGALDQEFVVIQGPPGTGKTFLGLQITGRLLRYSHGPILVVCYTNHALDQFLEGLLEYTTKIVRLGSQSKSEKLKQHTLKIMRLEEKIKVHAQDENEELRLCELSIRGMDNLLNRLQNSFGILAFDFIDRYIPLIQRSCFSYFTNEYLFIWLLQDTNNYLVDAAMDFEHLSYIYYYYLGQKESNNKVLTPTEIEAWLQDINASMHFMRKEIKSVDAAYQRGEMDEEEYHLLMADCNENMDWLAKDSEYIKTKLELLKNQLNKRYDDPPALGNISDPFNLSLEVRWQLYTNWLKEAETNIRVEKATYIRKYRNVYESFNAMLNYANVETMKRMSVIGMTTTCAARMYDTLKRVGCRVVVVEEAAEVVEAHIITVLTKDCQHLILLGDHQQLKPSTADYVLEKEYKLGISLFERMVKNNIQCHTLNVQHRMRKEIASLICPVIYPDLQNHPSVLEYPEVRGVQKSLYFIDHKNAEEEFGDSSKFNQFEAEYLPRLAEYFLKNGYSPEEVTILTAYMGQEVVVKKEIAKISYPDVQKVNVTCVDNFQGEESKIILLSLVRNNRAGIVGFLSIENRICVALSRAKEGLFVMGNLNQLCKASDIWKSIKDTLTSLEATGPSLPLVCTTHGNASLIKEIKDFRMVPEGGCNMVCEEELECGHICKKKCHSNSHLCLEVCNRKICEDLSHGLCQRLCSEECESCKHLVSVRLPCNHKHEVPCNTRNKLDGIKCMAKEPINLPCGHIYEKFCFDSIDKIKCNFEEKVVFPCGHSLKKMCFMDKFVCDVLCEKENLECKSRIKHISKVPCNENAKLCAERVKRFKKECGHIYSIFCSEDINAKQCSKPCKKTLSCGHRCSKPCWEACDPCRKTTPVQAECGHWRPKLCGSPGIEKCHSACSKKLDCGHNCCTNCGEPCECNLCNADAISEPGDNKYEMELEDELDDLINEFDDLNF